jgi:hypothetical protein
MSTAGDYDIVTDQGSSFSLHLSYQEDNGTPKPLEQFSGRMQVRRSPADTDMILSITGSTCDHATGNVHSSAITGGGLTGEFTGTGGVAGSGYMKMDVTAQGITNGGTGGILISIDADTMEGVPAGKHWYDLEIYSGVTVHKLIKGRFEVDREITR